jgi:hypothetical protein
MMLWPSDDEKLKNKKDVESIWAPFGMDLTGW